MAATVLILSLLSSLTLTFPNLITSETFTALTKGSSLTPQDILVSSPQHVFSSGFFPAGENAYIFSIWFTDSGTGNARTTVWMANRDRPVNVKNTALRLQNSGNLVLLDAGQQLPVWTSNTRTNSSSVFLNLRENGNLVLATPDGETLWQSFDFPTNTLLPGQPFTRNSILVSSRSQTNHSSGFYRMYFDGDSILHLRYEGPDITSVYWPNTWITLWSAGRSTFNSSKIAVLDSSGSFESSDLFVFKTLDFGVGIQRRMVLDDDGDLRVYSLDRENKTWDITWQHTSEPCRIHGICGENSLCVNGPEFGRKCTCLPGYRIKNATDWSFGCEPDFKVFCPNDDSRAASGFVHLPHVEIYGFDFLYFANFSFESCKNACREYCECKGIQYRFNVDSGYYNCWLKSTLFNGYRSMNFPDPMFIRLPEENLTKYPNPNEDFTLQCTENVVLVERDYHRKKDNIVRTFALCTFAIGAFEVACLLLSVSFRARKGPANPRSQGYVLASGSGFRKFSYSELKKASRNFRDEIGRGGAGVVYKGVLPDNRVVAIKFLKKAIQCEATFLAEINTIGRLNHMNLIEMWGFCAEGDRRLLVYKYLENESLAKNLHSGKKLDWKKRYAIAVGTAKGLAYLHEECLEWVLHCDVKPENILLNSDFQPKVADFGLSRILIRGEIENLGFSRIRGTRGYMAPEWVFNLPITSKVDVYSYGIVVLELVTGKSPCGGYLGGDGKAAEPKSLVGWVKARVQDGGFGDVVDPCLELDGRFDLEMVEYLVKVALQCTEEDREARPTMRQVVDMLLDQLVT